MQVRHLVDVHVLLLRGGRVLLSRRRDSDPLYDGRWHLPSGKLDGGESLVAGAAREAYEEVGVRIAAGELRHVVTLHVNAPGEPRVGVFFAALRWVGEPENREPDKCSGLEWFGLHDLPGDLIEYPAAGLRAYLDGRQFGVLGFD